MTSSLGELDKLLAGGQVDRVALTQQLDNIKEAKTKDDEENTQTISKLRQQLSQIQDEHRNAKETYEDKMKDVQRSVKQSQSEFDKDKALLE